MKIKFGIKQIIFLSIIAVCAAIIIVGDVVCSLHATEISTHLCPAEEIVDETKVEEANAAGEEVVQQIAKEGITLMKNNGVLPFAMPAGEEDKYKVNLFGLGCTDLDEKYNGGFFFTGTGSGAAGARAKKKVTFQKGLEQAGFEINTNLLAAYKTNKANFDVDWYTDSQTVLAEAKSFSDTAIVTISRMTGENQDATELTTDTTSECTIASKYIDRDEDGRNPLQLSLKEEAMLDYVCNNFENVVVLVNGGNTMELGYMERDEVDALLYVSHPGQSGTKQIGNILAGITNPSGHLTDTFVYDSKSDPTWANVIYREQNGRQIAYAEDIYFGYKWYETADEEGYFDEVSNQYGTGYDGVVQYPFGYGLSYTDFEWTVKDVVWKVGDETVNPESGATFEDRNTTVEITVSVKNTGDVPGKDVVQVYCTPPYTPGKIEKAHVNLIAFGKTDMIEPNESKDVTVSFDIYDMAAYDCYDKNNNGFAGWELDPGRYTVKLMNNAHEINPCAGAEIAFEVANEGTATEPIGFEYLFDPHNKSGIVINRFTGDTAENGVPIDGNSNGTRITYLSRADFAGTFPNETVPNRTSGADCCRNATYYRGWDNDPSLVAPRLNNGESNLLLFTTEGGGKPSLADLERTSGVTIVPNDALIMELGADYDNPKWDALLSQLSIGEIDKIVTSAGYGTLAIESVGKPTFLVHDGPSGFNRGMTQFGSPDIFTSFPVENLVAMTWNTDLARQEGAAIGVEAQATGEAGIYAPTVNLHRSSYNTRNFEAYSEDGVLSGYMGGAFILGARTHGAQTSLKHFVLSEPGKNPANVNTWLTEQNLRENYLKAFEIAVKRGGANYVMTAFNNIGGIKCAYSYELLNGVLRQEWGFVGSVVTDYGVGDAKSLIRAGNDLKLNPNVQSSGLSDGNKADVYCGVQAIKNDLFTYCNTYYSARTYDPTTVFTMVSRTQPFQWWILLLVLLNVSLALIIGYCTFRIFKPKKKKVKANAAEATLASGSADADSAKILAHKPMFAPEDNADDLFAEVTADEPEAEVPSPEDETAELSAEPEAKEEKSVAPDPAPQVSADELQKQIAELNAKIAALSSAQAEKPARKSPAKKKDPTAPRKPTAREEIAALKKELSEVKKQLSEQDGK